MVEAPGRRYDPLPLGPRRAFAGATRSPRRRTGAPTAIAGAFSALPVGAGGATVVPVGDRPTPPPLTVVGAMATWLPPGTRLDTGTGIIRIDCSSARSRSGQRVITSKVLPPSCICVIALPATAD